MLSLLALSLSSHNAKTESSVKNKTSDYFRQKERQNLSTVTLKGQSKQYGSYSMQKKIHRTYTETFHRPKLKEPRAFARNKTDFMSVTWQLQKPLIAQIKGIDFTKEEKLRLLNKKSNYRDYSAMLLSKRPQSQQNLRVKDKTLLLGFNSSKKKSIKIRQLCTPAQKTQKVRYRKKYKLLNMIGNRVPLHRLDESLRFDDSAMFVTNQHQ